MRALIILSLAAILPACTDEWAPALTRQPDSTIEFSPTQTMFERFTGMCGSTTLPPFGPHDNFALTLFGAGDTSVRRSTISVSFMPDMPLGQRVEVTLQPFANGQQSGQPDTGAGASFSWMQGADAMEVDDNPLAHVALQFDHIPTSEIDDGRILLDLTFTDGDIFDVEIAHAIHTGLVGPCTGGGGVHTD